MRISRKKEDLEPILTICRSRRWRWIRGVRNTGEQIIGLGTVFDGVIALPSGREAEGVRFRWESLRNTAFYGDMTTFAFDVSS